MIEEHLTRLTNAVSNRYSYYNLADWIEKNTKLEGEPFSYVGHEYQRDIIQEKARTVLVNKAAQTGLSEIFARYMLATACTIENWTALWTFPSSSDAERFTKARIDPIINNSPAIKTCLSRDVNSVELKQFNANSFIYVRGTLSDTGALSVPVDILCHDELDRSDMDNIAAYVSRLQHKEHKLRRLFSTPTLKGRGIDLMCQTATRKRQVWKCSNCNHTWLPDYFQDVKIPGYEDDLKLITKVNLPTIKWRHAKLLCPKCGREPSSDLKYREWVVENPNSHYEEVAYYVSPFCAPTFITPSYLVKVSTEYGKTSEFMNQSLGLTAENDDEVLTEADVKTAIAQANLSSNDLHYMGFDMGLICHVAIGRMASDGTLLVVHTEKVHYTKFIERRQELIRLYRVVLSVHDMFPYTDLITKVTDNDPNAYGAVYVTKATSESYVLKKQEEDTEEGKLNVRAVHINRDISFDELMYEFKANRVRIQSSKEDLDLVTHLTDMKRVQSFDKTGGIRMRWEKSSQAVDHYHHALLYLYTAIKMRGVAAGWVNAGAVPFVSSFKLNRNNY
jgi:hypothetical protein